MALSTCRTPTTDESTCSMFYFLPTYLSKRSLKSNICMAPIKQAQSFMYFYILPIDTLTHALSIVIFLFLFSA